MAKTKTVRYIRGFIKLQLFTALVLSCALFGAGFGSTDNASAAACGSEPTSTTGKASQSITVPATGSYTIWSRMKAPSTSPVEYQVYIDGQCFTIGQTALTQSTLTWVDYENGSTSDKATLNLTAGSHTLVMTAGTEDLELDRVMLLSDSCTPTGTGDNCNTDSTLPESSITSPSDASTISGTTAIMANATDNDAIDYVEFYRDGTTLLGTDTTSPYSYDWDTTAVSDGPFALTVRAYDLSGNVETSAVVNVTVNNASPVNASISSFTATPATIIEGQSSTLNWNVAAGQNCSIDQSVGAVATSGSISVNPTTTTTYTLTCDGLNGGSADTGTVTLTVNPAPINANVSSFTATPGTIVEGQSSTLDWTVSAGENCSIDQAIGSVATTGSQLVTPTVNTTYALTCQGLNGGFSDTENITITVNPAPVNAVISTFTASPVSITDAPGQSSTLNWSVVAGTDCNINQGVGNVSLTGTRSVTPTATTIYTLSCEGQFGGTADSATATVTVTPAPDTDGDNVKDYIEAAAPNSGDANDDGTLDSEQANVSSFINTRTGSYNTLVAAGDCDVLGNVSSINGKAAYLMGATGFTLECAVAGQAAQVELLLDREYDTSSWDILKVNSGLTAETDISRLVTVSSVQIGGDTQTRLAYTLVDGGKLDEDGIADGTVVDPIAIMSSSPVIGAPDSGYGSRISEGAILTTGSLGLIGLGLAGMWYFRNISRAPSAHRRK